MKDTAPEQLSRIRDGRRATPRALRFALALLACGPRSGASDGGSGMLDESGTRSSSDADASLSATSQPTSGLESTGASPDVATDVGNQTHPYPHVLGVSASSTHVCAWYEGDHLRCWGSNERGGLGYGHHDTIGDDEPAYAAGDVPVPEAVAIVAVGVEFTCMVSVSGTPYCWGANEHGQLGRGDTADVDNASDAIPIAFPRPAVQIVAGEDYACARLDDGTVHCWGSGYAGQLGTGSGIDVGDDEPPFPAGRVELPAPATDIAVAQIHSCAVVEGGALYCWGSNYSGALGIPSAGLGSEATPMQLGPVETGGSVIDVATGIEHTCVALAGGAVRCWGDARLLGMYPLPSSTYGDDELPTVLPLVDVGMEVAGVSSRSGSTCAWSPAGRVRCWSGAVGYPNLPWLATSTMTPAELGDIDVGELVAYISAGGSATCGLTVVGDVRCWGYGSQGLLGQGNTEDLGDDEPPSAWGPVPIFAP